jgi:bifunctional non-homologous end joining protein LigD
MSKDSQLVQIRKRKIELSNLDKILFPEKNIIKAQVIEYYLKMAPAILYHIQGRPLSLVRFPDGIYGEKFFQKDKPTWTPDWIEYVNFEIGKDIEYIIATEEATLVWLANLASIELHQVHSRVPKLNKPDYMVFDLDPPEGYKFENVVGIALELRTVLENYGYHTFVKTTGGKGVHIVVPIEPKWYYNKVFETAQLIAVPFVNERSKYLTLQIRKETRKGKVLVDIFRMRQAQTIIAPYSIRGSKYAPVSMPLKWETLEKVKDPNEFNLLNVPDIVKAVGDAWEGINAYSTELHTEHKKSTIKKTKSVLKESKKYKTPEQLKKYSEKRNPDKTPEPAAVISGSTGNSFVIHRHQATRLHYDLRMEKDGVLRSWAVPKGLPPLPGIKRLAVQTEDHPLEYLKFEGIIPKGQYGGGKMWLYATGKYERYKEKKNGFYFRFHSTEISGEFRMHNTKDKEWLLERVNIPQIDWLHENIGPMLSQTRKNIPESDDYIYEVKWDGIRVLISLDENKITLRSRNNFDLTKKFPELLNAESSLRASCALLDGEIVCLDEEGKPDFGSVIQRMHRTSEAEIERAMKKHPAYCYVFDILYLDGRPVVNEPLIKRREWVDDVIKKNTPFRVSEIVDDGKSLLKAVTEHGLEGVMAKERNSKYLPGKRTDSWYKIKVNQTAECYILGYTKGKGSGNELIGALHIGEYINDKIVYRGKVGSGFTEKSIKEIYTELKKIKESKKIIKDKIINEKQTTWLEPMLVCEIKYLSITKDNYYRGAVFLRLRPDISIKYKF